MIVCIAGMHRSGTSLVGKLLYSGGVYLGDESELAKPAPDNPEGFWENHLFLELNEQLLAHFGGGWDLPPVMPVNWANEIDPAFVQRGLRLIQQFDSQKVWGWKDPRTSLTLPFWKRLIPDLKVIICLRNPLEVAESLQARGHSSILFGLNLWQEYNERLMTAVEGLDQMVTHYENLLQTPQTECQRLMTWLGLGRTTPDQVTSVVRQAHRHHTASLVQYTRTTSTSLQALYAELCKKAEAAAAPVVNVAPADDTFASLQDVDKKSLERQVHLLEEELITQKQVESELIKRISETRLNEDKLLARIQFLNETTSSLKKLVIERDKGISWLRSQPDQARRELEEIKGSKFWKMRNAWWAVRKTVERLISLPLGRARRRLTEARFGAGKSGSTNGTNYRLSQGFTAQLTISPSIKESLEAVISQPVFAQPAHQVDVICFSIIDWSFRFQRPQQLMAQFARHGHRVFYINVTSFLPAEQSPRFQINLIGENIYEVRLATMTALDIYQEVVDGDNLDVVVAALDELRAHYHVGDAIGYVMKTSWARVAMETRRRWGWRIIYDCMDEWENFPGIQPAIVEIEPQLVQDCDLLVVTARRLYEKWKNYNTPMALVRNGADYDFYERELQANNLLAGVTHPVVGYYGAIADWFDIALMCHVAAQRPNYTFVLLGGVFDVDVSALKALPNVQLLGQQPYALMPRYLYHFDVCIIPFKLNPITEATDPVKLYEYFSGGRPVVSTNLPELAPYHHYLYIAGDQDDFLTKLDAAVAENDLQLQAARKTLAKQHTWVERYRVLWNAFVAVTPLTSIVIVTYNNRAITQLCLESLQQNTDYPNFEIVVVDNASSDDTPAYLTRVAEQYPAIKIILNTENKGFAAANNQGLGQAKGQYLVLLNNDTIVPPGWLSGLLRPLKDKRVGLVGPTTNFVGNEAKVDAPYTTWSEMEVFAQDRARLCAGQVADIHVLAMYCVAMRREVYEAVGSLDEQFGVGLFEDDDYAMRVRQMGYRVVCALDVFVHHVGQAAFGKLIEDGSYNPLFDENRRYYETKWAVAWEPHQNRPLIAGAPASQARPVKQDISNAINSREWYDAQFKRNWVANNGPAQTHYFMSCIVANLPEAESFYLKHKALSILDWGCAFGDGVDVLQKSFPKSRVSGLDFSDEAIKQAKARYPECAFTRSDTIPDAFDIIVTSNCLEHFKNPFEVIEQHLEKCRKLYIALVPFEEGELLRGHQFRFSKRSFPSKVGNWPRIFLQPINADPKFWAGQQILAIYASPAYLEEIQTGGNEAVSPGSSQPAVTADYRHQLALESKKWGDHLQFEAAGEWLGWLDHPLIAAHYKERGLIDGKRWEQWALQYLEQPAERSLDLGCGAGSRSLAVWEMGVSKHISGIDISEARVAEGEKNRATAGAPGHLWVADVNTIRLTESTYDLIFSCHSFHHFLNLEHVMAEVSKALTPKGLFILEEFVGPTQFQWTTKQLQITNRLLNTLPEPLRYFKDGRLKQAEGRPTPEEVVAVSPFESIRSAEIWPLFQRYFDVIVTRPLGGTVQLLLYNGIAHNFRPENPDSAAHIRRIYEIEDSLIESGELPSDVMLLIGKRKVR